MAIETKQTITALSQTIPAIAGIDNPSQARVVLYQAGRPVHAPLDQVGLLTDTEAADTYLPLVGGTVTGDLTVAGDMTGNVTGNVTGNLTGDVTAASVSASSSLILPQGTTPTPTAEGSVAWDTDDNAFKIGDGAATRVFRSSEWETIGVTTVTSSTASVAFTNLSPYRQLRLTGHYRLVTDATYVIIRTSTNNGSSYDAGASDYTHLYWAIINSVTSASASSTTSILTVGGAAASNTATATVIFDFQFENFNQASYGIFQGRSGWITAAVQWAFGHFYGYRTATTARNALQVSGSGGNIASGQFHLEGVRG